ncbi:MAG: leucine-rich repeat domain-containing protein [Cytophagales bacterium]|jgi:hypothetical protein|nr:leucine-rich repeat domain-containing protein [Cytophagales bacterium]
MADTTRFLLEQNEEQQQLTENIRRLLFSTDDANVKMAVEIMKGSGVPETLYEDLLVCTKILPNADLRNAVRKLLSKQPVPAEWQPLLENTVAFANLQTAKEKDIRDKMSRMAKETGWEGAAQLGYAFFRRFGKGLSYVLTYPKDNPFRIKALQLLTDGDLFDFHSGIGYHNWKNERPQEVILSKVDTGIKFPDDHPNAADIRVIVFHNCKFNSIPADVKVFENVQEMDLSVNNLNTLPPAFAKLTKLRKLDLSFNRLTRFPPVLLKMKSLEDLNLQYNGQTMYYDKPGKLEIPEEFRTEVPNCEVLV